MRTLFETGRVVDLILIVLAVETMAVMALLRLTRCGVAGVLANLAAGACLLLGVRAALIGLDWPWVALWIGLSLPFHVIDLATRQRTEPAHPRRHRKRLRRQPERSGLARASASESG